MTLIPYLSSCIMLPTQHFHECNKIKFWSQHISKFFAQITCGEDDKLVSIIIFLIPWYKLSFLYLNFSPIKIRREKNAIDTVESISIYNTLLEVYLQKIAGGNFLRLEQHGRKTINIQQKSFDGYLVNPIHHFQWARCTERIVLLFRDKRNLAFKLSPEFLISHIFTAKYPFKTKSNS